jgi:hypothetical protein
VYGIAVATLSGLLRARPPTEASDAGADLPVPGALTGVPQEAPVPGG